MEAVITLIASGDRRLDANQKCWPAQKKWRSCFRELVQLVRRPFRAIVNLSRAVC
jgi:hypothetical protein